jgi:hypothetical protein
MDMAMGNWGNTTQGFERNDANREFAIKELVNRRAWGNGYTRDAHGNLVENRGLRQVREHLGQNPTAEGAAVWRAATGGSNFSTMLQGAPNLVSGGNNIATPMSFNDVFGSGEVDAAGNALPDTYGSLNGDSLQNMHHNSMHHFLENLQHEPDPAVRQRRTESLTRALEQVRNDPDKRSKMRPQTLQLIHQYAQQRPQDFDPGLITFVNNHLTATGQIT